jgi:hypothetical protein
MAIIYTPKKLGMRILNEFYIRHNRCPGEWHATGTFLHTDGWNSNDLSNGLNYCVEKGWLEKVHNSWILTEEGFRVSRLEREKLGESVTTNHARRCGNHNSTPNGPLST